MQVFDDIERTELRVPRAEESKFSYLNSSGRPEAAAVRAHLESCLTRYPADHREALITRLRSIDTTYDAAVFELLTHELLIRAGHEVVAVEPAIPGKSTSPDFLMRAPNGTEFVVECVVATGQSDGDQAAQRRLTTALDAVAAVPSPEHYLSVTVDGLPSHPVSLKILRRELSAWIAQLPAGETGKGSPALQFEQHGLRLNISVMMPRRKPPQPGDRSVGSIFYGIRMARPGEDLRGSLLQKANKYGQLEQPYVIAVNCLGNASGERDLLNALLGSPVGIIRRDADGDAQFEGGRANDGVWYDGRRARKRGVSAILSFDRMDPWRPSGRGARLIRNPWAIQPLPDISLPLDQLNPVDGEFVRVDGPEPQAMFGLAENWPE